MDWCGFNKQVSLQPSTYTIHTYIVSQPLTKTISHSPDLLFKACHSPKLCFTKQPATSFIGFTIGPTDDSWELKINSLTQRSLHSSNLSHSDLIPPPSSPSKSCHPTSHTHWISQCDRSTYLLRGELYKNLPVPHIRSHTVQYYWVQWEKSNKLCCYNAAESTLGTHFIQFQVEVALSNTLIYI